MLADARTEEFRPEAGKGRSERNVSSPLKKIASAVFVVVILLLVMIFLGLQLQDPRTTPQGTLNAIVNAVNNNDAMAFINCTVMKFSSNSIYSFQLNATQSLNALKVAGVQIEITILSVTYPGQMTLNEQGYVDVAKSQLAALGASVTVNESCIASLTMDNTVGDSRFFGTYPDILLKINGLWYSSNWWMNFL